MKRGETTRGDSSLCLPFRMIQVAVRLVGAWAVLMTTGSQAEAVEHRIMVPTWEKVLAHDGNGEWDYYVPRGAGGEPAEGEVRRGEAVDNTGRIYFSDSFNDRLLVFSPDGERLSIVNVKERLRFPTDIWADETHNVFVSGATPDGDLDDAQIILSPTTSGWNVASLDYKTCDLAPNAQTIGFGGRQIVPLGSGGLRVLPVLVEGKGKYQMLDKQGKSVGFAPSMYRDQKGRFYDIVENYGELRVFNKAGEFVSQTKMPNSPARLVRYRGWIYVYVTNRLYRFAEDGAIEEEIESSSKQKPLWPGILASPYADPFYTCQIQEEKGVQSFIVTKWEYRKAPSESEAGASRNASTP